MEYQVVGYGSLESHESLKETIKDKPFKQIIVKGYKRVFNLKEEKSKDPDVLNLIKNKKSDFNGVLFKVNEKELKKIKEREDIYNIEETLCYNFNTNKKLSKCLIFIDKLIYIDNKNLLPNKEYFILCRKAAYKISKKFGEYWDNSTYTSSGEKISDWLKSHKEYNKLD